MTNKTHPLFTVIDLGCGSGDYWVAQCLDCGWTGSSNGCEGGLPDYTGDYSDLLCPRCESNEIEEAYDEKNN